MVIQAAEQPQATAPPDEPLPGASAVTAQSRWPAILGALLTLAMVAGLARGIAGSGVQGLWQAMPANPLFYITFVFVYVALPVGDFIIFRRLWHIPVEGLAALFKKRIANEIVIGYSGEAYFYAWAKARARMVAAPFGAVKDVSILSAMAGNVITLALVVMALPFVGEVLRPADFRLLAWSVAILVAISLPFLIFARRVFTLPRRSLWWIFGVHALRLVGGTILLALAWHFALPTIAIGVWLMLCAARMLVSRLPLVPNKDLLFANFAIALIGYDNGLSALLAVTAGITLLIHAGLIAMFSLFSLIRNRV
ncbi:MULTISPECIES: hypothetical protein [unclassified Sphingomonas]|uniref:hypothetical protein n=1 Tax=unclassified Sphingomonas TaxID=196159 RepID=UPI000BC61308|nr:MAG: hypothetical protein B7Y98_04975 [Sphingomonas sp. 32-62-10]